MLRKIKLYFRALYKGELLKKIEYKLKDLIGYFYIRNKLEKQRTNLKLKDISLNIDSNNFMISSDNNDEKIKIFNEYNSYVDVKNKLNADKIFWRSAKLSKYSDVKIVWEYNRLQFLIPTAIKYIKTKQIDYKNNIIEIIDKWEKCNEYEYSINWNSNLEVAIRSISISLTLMILDDENLNKRYTHLLYLHAKHIYNEIDYSICCIPNNHVIGEATALLLLSKIIDTKENKKWYQKSIKILEKKLNIIDEDGVSKENSFSYQWFVTKMYILSLCFITDKNLFNLINNKIIKSLNILKYIYIDENTYLNYGDNDDGYLYSIYMKYNIIRDIKEYYKLFYKNEISNETSLYTTLLKKFNPNNQIIIANEKDNNYIATKKIFIYKNNNNLLFFNAKNIEGHAHNDSLSINLIIDGKEILLDSGTFSYNLSKEERSYYRNRGSHTTIQLDRKNAIAIGTFRWINNAECYIDQVEENNDYIKVIGVLKNICSREIKIYRNKNLIEISDYVYIDSEQLISNFIMPYDSNINDGNINVYNVKLSFNKIKKIEDDNVKISKKYFVQDNAKRYKVFSQNKLMTTIKWSNIKKG